MKNPQKPYYKPKRSVPLFTAALAAVGLISGAQAQIQTAGDLLVNVDASSLSPGPLNAITNSGTMGGFFEARDPVLGTPANIVPEVAAVNGNGSVGIRFNGVSFLRHYDSLGGALKPADASLVGGNPTSSIEAWVFNPSISEEETILSWGKRGTDGNNYSFNYGSDFRWGAMGRWGNADIGWNDNGGAPAAGKWHHLVATYDGTTTRMYADGILQNQEVFNISTASGLPINLAAQVNADNTMEGGLRGSLTIARVRIHADTLTAEQVANNYNFEKNDFNTGTPLALPSGPSHRYSFSNPAGTANNGDVVTDSIGSLHGTIQGGGATFTGSRVSLPGGASATAPYIDLPNGLLSNHSTDKGGSGEVTFEGWVKITGNQSWSRILDFGSTDIGGGVQGEVNGVGGGGAGQDYLFYSAQNGGNVNVHTLVVKNADSPSGNVEDGLDVGTYTFNTDLHFAITWNESTGEVKVYENGVYVKTLNSRSRMSDINDVNVWLGRSNWAPDANTQSEYDEFRVYDRVLPAEQIRASYETGPNSLAVAVPVNITLEPVDQTIEEFGTAQFTVAAEGAPPIGYQWFKNGEPIPGATSPTLTLTDVRYSENGSTYFARATNNISGTGFSDDSATVTLVVNPDLTAPTISRVRVVNSNAFEIIFSERVNASDAANIANYSLFSPAGEVVLASAVQGADASHVVVTAAAPFTTAYYQLFVSGIHDISTSANEIGAGTEGGFLYTVANGLQHRWTFNNAIATDATGATVPDIVGGADGQVKNLTGITTLTGDRVTLSGGQSSTAPYIDLPNGLLSTNGVANGGSGEITFEGWVKITGSRDWSRIFDFGSTTAPDTAGELFGPGGGGNGRDYVFLAAQRGGAVNEREVSIQNEDPGGGGGSATPLYNGTGLNVDTHFVVTWNENAGEIRVYENGVEKRVWGNGTKMSDIRDVNVWLGRSNWVNDQNTQGEYDEFRIYNRIMTPDQVSANYAAGPDNNVGAPQSITLSVTSTNMVENDFQASRALVSFANVANLDLASSGGITFETSDPNVLTVDANGIITSMNAGVATVTANFAGLSASQTINVVAQPLVLKHRYTFCEQPGSAKAHDVVSGAHGILNGGAAYNGGGLLFLNGIDGYVDLPNGIISTLTNATFEMWITYNDNRSWGRVFDFGSSVLGEGLQGGGSNYIFFAAQGPTNFRFESKPTGVNPTPLLFGSGPLVTNEEVHVVISYNELSGQVRMYTNGVLIDADIISTPLSSIADFNNWLGRSQYNDPYYQGSYNEFRIYQGAMTPAQVLASYQAGPDAPISSTRLSIERVGENMVISYPAGNCDFFLESATELVDQATVWSPVNASLNENNDRYEFTVPIDSPVKFFRLSK